MTTDELDKKLAVLKTPYDMSYVDSYEARQIINHLVEHIAKLELRLQSIFEMGN